MLLRLELRHRKQIAEMVEPVALGEPGKVGQHLGDETRGFVRPAIARRLEGRRSALPLRG